MTAEKALLGCMMKENYLIGDTMIKAEHFADPRHQALYKQMQMRHQQGKLVDLVTLSTTVDMEPCGGISYLHDLQSCTNVKKFEEYEWLVLEKWKEREKSNILTIAKEEDWEIQKVIHALDQINETKIDDYLPISTGLVDLYEAPWQEEKQIKGMLTGIKRLDQMTNGFQAGELTVVAARPSMGKTDVMLHFAKQAGWHEGLPIIFSLEMPNKSLIQRLIASTGTINRLKLRNPHQYLSQAQKQQWPELIGHVSETNIQIFDGAGQTVAEMRAKIRKLIHENPNKQPLVLIDYLTLIRPEHHYGGNAHMQVTEITKRLKGMAKEMNCPVLLLAQLNRAVEQRQNKRPMMSDIRESGSVEQDADVIIFLYRDRYYDRDSEEKHLELIISKNRNGPVGTVMANYNEFTGGIRDVHD
ncbi:replicative DNA helicase [Lederbergia galactosidilyticus]|uniref:replicative DNA helicase n=1 Tax=Lederbergia galactosidilytica TaxID=217031 RepID=UPI001AE3A5E2|nr:replicative DNA helicase [Lederbergia galactosidilytica]MBP1913073.1 replicative DNA helicase [Lederbergia galactosidilytica]